MAKASEMVSFSGNSNGMKAEEKYDTHEYYDYDG